MASAALENAMRAIAALCGVVLLVPIFVLQLFPGHTGWSPGIVLGLLVLGGPSGLLLYFARTGRRAWPAAVIIPVIAIVQSASVLAALAAFPRSPAMHMTAGVASSWLVILSVHALRLSRNAGSNAA